VGAPTREAAARGKPKLCGRLVKQAPKRRQHRFLNIDIADVPITNSLQMRDDALKERAVREGPGRCAMTRRPK
jgi:hypothetical protein